MASCLAFLLCGCDEEYTPELNLSNTTYEIPAEGGVYSVNYSVANPMAGGVIKASCLESADWIGSFDTSKEGVVSFTVDANELPEDRSAVIELAYAPSDIKQTVTVKQLAGPELTLAKTEYEVPALGGVYTLEYSVANPTANGEIKVSCPESVDWIGSFETSEDGVVAFTVDANKLSEDRTVVIDLTYAPFNIKKSVTVKQLALGTPKKSDFIGRWNVIAEKWNLDGRSWCYQMDDDSDDGYAHDENGNYIIISVKQYCEEYAAAWNADPDNASSGYTATAEDMAYRLYSDIEMKGTFTFTNDSVNFDWGLTNGFTVNMMKGKYTYDETTCVAKINDTAIEDDPRDVSMNIAFAEDGMMSFEYTEFHLYTFSSYDGMKEYWINAPIIFYCEPVK